MPTVTEKFQVISIRCPWRVENNDVHRASEQISAKRRQLEVLMTENSNILLFITSLTAHEQGVQERSQGSVEDGESMSENENDDVDPEKKSDTARKKFILG